MDNRGKQLTSPLNSQPFRRTMRALLIASLATLLASPFRPGYAQRTGDLIAEARAFMQEYEKDLQEYRADSIIARYDPRGAVVIVNGQGGAKSLTEIGALYRSAPVGPSRFAWTELAYETAGDNIVFVRGGFVYQVRADMVEMSFAYAAVLVRDQGRLKIVFEHEQLGARPSDREPTWLW